MQVCSESHADLKQTPRLNIFRPPITSYGVADTGCSTLCAGPFILRKLGLKRKDLLKSYISLKVADGRRLTVLGAIPVTLRPRGDPMDPCKHMLHITQELKSVFLSKNYLKDLGIISKTFPFPSNTAGDCM